jgi:hypothetical protein
VTSPAPAYPGGSGVFWGEVVEFDPGVGLGAVLTDADRSAERRRHPFHCTRIAGGSRTIDVGTRVSFRFLAGRHGVWEAAAITPSG